MTRAFTISDFVAVLRTAQDYLLDPTLDSGDLGYELADAFTEADAVVIADAIDAMRDRLAAPKQEAANGT